MFDEPPYDEAADPVALRGFIDELEAAGFERVASSRWEGPTHHSLLDGGHTDSETMTIIIRPAWPYLPPLLRVPGVAAWHADREELCIWHGEDASQRWLTLGGIYDRICEWVDDERDGFAAIENARNPEIYWQQEGDCFAALVDIDTLIGADPVDGAHGEFRFAEARSIDGRPSPIVVLDLERGKFQSSSPRPFGIADHRHVRGRWFYRASVRHPPRTIDELRSLLTDAQRARLDRDLLMRRVVMYGLVWPNNAGLVATMILSMLDGSDARTNALVILRPKGREALLLRAGPDAAILQQRKVTIMGVGAIGSHVAEQLARAGIGQLLVVDYDRLWPANLIRHAAPPNTPAGTTKTTALRESLSQYPWISIDEVADVVWTPSSLRDLISSADLTIEATGHAGLAELAGRVALDTGKPVVSVALFRGGAVARVRRQALERDTPFVHRPHLDRYPVIAPFDDEIEYVGTETGCLALVHNAPPVSVARAASLAVEVAIDTLTERHEHDDEILEVMRRGDPPFDRLGRVRPCDLPITVDLTERSQTHLRELARAALPAETGGIVLGCFVDGRAVISEIAEVRDADATETSYTIHEGATRDLIDAARKTDLRLGYLGEWHSHPTSAGPSPRDIAAMIALANPDGDGDTDSPLLLLVHPEAEGSDDVEAFVATDNTLKPAQICITGDLPNTVEEGQQ